MIVVGPQKQAMYSGLSNLLKVIRWRERFDSQFDESYASCFSASPSRRFASLLHPTSNNRAWCLLIQGWFSWIMGLRGGQSIDRYSSGWEPMEIARFACFPLRNGSNTYVGDLVSNLILGLWQLDTVSLKQRCWGLIAQLIIGSIKALYLPSRAPK